MAQDPNNYWEQLERLEKLIRASELKAGVIFSFHSLILGLFVDRLDTFQSQIEGKPLLIALLVLWMCTVLISIYFCFKCFMPRIETKMKRNVFFFRDAAANYGGIEEYTKELMKVCGSEEELYTLLSEQIFIESEIITGKFNSVQRSIRFFAVSLVVAGLFVAAWLITS